MKLIALILAFLLPASCALGEMLSLEEMLAAQDAALIEETDEYSFPGADDMPETQQDAAPEAPAQSSAAREELINRILSTAHALYDEADGRARRAQLSGDIYVCKNFSVHIFRENCEDFRLAEYPNVPLVIPNNQKKADCAPYVYCVEWQDVPASEGNPFYAAATFRYDEGLSKEENRQIARRFLMEAKRGDYFQMAANYYYGVGAHSMVFIADYNPETDTVRWTDSNMKGKSINGERYAYVQYDAEKEIDWFVDAFCRRKYGATIYRLRNDIIYAK